MKRGAKKKYTTEILRIKVVFSDPYYHLVDMKGEDIRETIYEKDIVKYVPRG